MKCWRHCQLLTTEVSKSYHHCHHGLEETRLDQTLLGIMGF